MRLKKLAFMFFSFVWLLLVLTVSYYSLAYVHETTHQTIYSYHGIDSEIKLFRYPNAVTIPNSTQEKELCDDVCKLSQNQVDIVGYPLVILTELLILFFCMKFIMDAQIIRAIKNKEINKKEIMKLFKRKKISNI